MSIREAEEADIPRIVEMGSRSLAEGPYRGIIKDNPQAVGKLARNLLASPSAKILVAEVDGKVVGVMGFALYEHFYSGEPTAQELIWYLVPEARSMKSFGDSVAFELLREGERRAKEAGAEIMYLTAPTEAIGKLYERRGYRQIEVGYQRRLECLP